MSARTQAGARLAIRPWIKDDAINKRVNTAKMSLQVVVGGVGLNPTFTLVPSLVWIMLAVNTASQLYVLY